jgi:tripartite-type tricarboxylate transporter receptor subunit TctC
LARKSLKNYPKGKEMIFMKNLFKICFLTSFLIFFSFIALFAQSEYPSKPITYLIGYPPGGLSDLTGRALAAGAEKVLKQPVIVVNKPGASSSLEMSLLAQAKPDGYTIGAIPSTATVIMPHVQKVAYDPLKDFTFIINCFNYAAALVVRADAPWKNFNEFVEYARKNPKAVKYGTYGAYGTTTLVMESLGKQLNIKWDTVPFKSDADAVVGLLGGHIIAAASASMYAPQVRAGKLRILAMMSHKRSPEFPDVPTLKEFGYNLVAEGFVGVGGPKGLSEPIIKRLEEAFTQAVKDPPYLELIKKLALIEDYKNSKEFSKFVEESFHLHGELIKKVGLDALKQ